MSEAYGSPGHSPIPQSHPTSESAQPNLRIAHRKLPHWYLDGSTYFVTFRLADSVPSHVLRQWEEERVIWLRNNPEPHSEKQLREKEKLFSERREAYLDAGHGSCVLRDKDAAHIVEKAMLHFEGVRYDLGSWVIMPNHVHLLLTPREGWSLSKILHSWKSFTANKINKLLGRDGTLWQDESYDHIVRSEDQLRHFQRYMVKNVEQVRGDCLHDTR